MTPTTEAGKALYDWITGDVVTTRRAERQAQVIAIEQEAAAQERERLRAKRAEIRAAISNAYYETRDEGQTMDVAADRAVDGVLALLADPEAPDGD